MTVHSYHWTPRTPALSVGTVAAMVIGFLLMPAIAGAAEENISGRQADQVVAVTDVQSHDGLVTGKLINRSGETLQNVRVMIDHAWLWNNERKPGVDNPSRTYFYVVPEAIPPHGSVTFQYQIGSPPQRTDGRFETIVQVTGFTEVGSQQAAR